jgi:hypothetical protein
MSNIHHKGTVLLKFVSFSKYKIVTQNPDIPVPYYIDFRTHYIDAGTFNYQGFG